MRYTVVYYPVHGRAESIRLLLASLGLPFDEQLITPQTWPQLKPTMPLGQVPVLIERDDAGHERRIPQSQAILRHLGRAHGRYGRDEDAMLRADVLAETVHDARLVLGPLLAPATRGKDPVALKQAFDEKLPPALARLETLHGPVGHYFVDDVPTWADCLAFDLLETLQVISPTVLAPYPGLARFVAAMRADAGLAPYLETRRPSELAPLRQVLETGIPL
jgi:glutathione S-transferase